MNKTLIFFLPVFLLFLCGEAVSRGEGEVPGSQPLSLQEGTGPADAGAPDRIVTDLAGNRVPLPPAEALRRVVIISPPLFPQFLALQLPEAELAGVNRIAYAGANKELMDLMYPSWRDVPTGFLIGFTANTEELLNLDPDIILVYGDFQKEGLWSLSVPILDFAVKNRQNETCTIAMDRLMREAFGLQDRTSGIRTEWEVAKNRTAPSITRVRERNLTGLMIMDNTGDSITVRGRGSYGDDWLVNSGLTNVVQTEADTIETSMEQIYQWNPDVIYVFQGIPARDYLTGQIPKQNWSPLSAFQRGAIFDTPRSLMNWGAPNPDSPLMLQWMVGKNAPDLFNESDFLLTMQQDYRRRYGIELSDSLAESILYPNGR